MHCSCDQLVEEAHQTDFWLQDGFCRFGKALGKGRNGEVQVLHAHFLPGAIVKSSASIESLQHEAEILADIQHPNVVAGYGTMWGPVLADGSRQIFLAMERLDHSLADRIKDMK